MTLCEIIEFCTEWFSVCSNISSEFRTIAIFESFAKQTSDFNKTCRYIYDLLLYQTSFVLSATVHELSSQNKVLILTFNRSAPAYFFHKNCLLKAVHPLDIFRRTKFHGPSLTGASFGSTSEV
jgi:hypothetical protein